MKKKSTLILGIWPVIGLGVSGASYATDSGVDGYVPKTEYEKLKREVETLKTQMQRLLEAAPATPASKPAVAETKGEKKPVPRAPPHLKRELPRLTKKNLRPRRGTAARRQRRPKGNWTSFYALKSFYSSPGRSNWSLGPLTPKMLQ
ncbi:MAG: hypothetical protein ACREVK_09185 [Gammaproteobacteria bacterium]